MSALREGLQVPPELFASEPPEARGLTRDGVRLLVARPDGITHASFRDLGEHLHPGDLLVVNTSQTVPSAVTGTREDGSPVTVHLSTPLPSGEWVVELRSATLARTDDARRGEQVTLPGGVVLTLGWGWPGGDAAGSRLWRTGVPVEGDVLDWLEAVGRPIRYDYVADPRPIADYQTVFARDRGSAEMPSAARPLSTELVTELVSRGVAVAPVTLHTGVSSLEAGESPLPERYRVPPATARLVELTRAGGGRVVAAGTTVTRALETVAVDGRVRPGEGWTDLVLGPDRPARVVDGLITGWHDAEASHLSLLEAVAGPVLVRRAYDAAIEARYRWHEFGDSCLLLP